MSIAVDIEHIDAALAAKYSGINVYVSGVLKPVEVFIEEPNIEEYPERIFPSISLKFMGLSEDVDSLESLDDEAEEVDYDAVSTPNVRSMRDRPVPCKLMYSVDTWHRGKVSESRDLLQYAVLRKTPPRSYLTVQNIDGENVDLWVFWSGGIAGNDERLEDEVIYHKTLTLEIPAHITKVDYDDVEETKVAMELHWKTYVAKTIMDQTGIQWVSGADVLDLGIKVTDTTEEPLP